METVEQMSEQERNLIKKQKAKFAYDRYRREHPEKFRKMVLESTKKYNERNKELIKEKYVKRYALIKEKRNLMKILLDDEPIYVGNIENENMELIEGIRKLRHF